MAKLRSSNIEPSTATTLALGASSDSILISSDSLRANTWQDLGGNSLFVSNGSGTLSSVNSGLEGGGYTLLATNTISSAVSETSFTTLINSTYDEYIWVCSDMHCTSDAAFSFQVSSDGGSSYGMTITSNFFTAHHYENNSSYGLALDNSGELYQATGYQMLGVSIGGGADEGISTTLHIFSPASTTYTKQFIAEGNLYAQSDYTQNVFVGGYVNSTTAINAINFKYTTGSIDGGVIQMYGVA